LFSNLFIFILFIFYAFCNNQILKQLSKIGKHNFCSKDCCNKFIDQKTSTECFVCSKSFYLAPYRIKASSRHFCSVDCFSEFKRTKKDWGSTRSKLEVAIEEHLKNIFSFDILFNKREIGYELDIYIPHINLALEINGIFHYKPIYDEKHFLRTQHIDKEKSEECQKRNIKLVIIDVSNDGKSKIIQAQRIEEVVKIINDRIEELNLEPELIELSE
jgi:hypothetical protein